MSDTFGNYHLLAALGSGGMADVLLAHAGSSVLGLGKLVVLKCIRPHLAEDGVFIAMLVEEARLAARLNHPNVVQTLEVGEVDGRYFIAMEYLEGQVLTRVQRAANARALPKAIQYRILLDVLSGLHHAHELADYDGTELGIVHRDATPHNVLVTYDGVAKLIDFGVAKAAGHGVETVTGIIKGKLGYMAPEQAMAVDVDRRADVFSVGVMLWEVATGKRMWSGVQDAVIFRRLATGDVPCSPRAVEPTVPEELDRICRRALAVQADDRYATALELQQDLEAYLAAAGELATTRDVARAMNEVFADERQRMRHHVEGELGRVDRVPAALSLRTSNLRVLASFPGARDSVEQTPTSQPSRPVAPPTAAAAPGAREITSDPPPAYTRAAGRAAPEPSRLPWVLVAALAGCIAFVVAWRPHAAAPAARPAAHLPALSIPRLKTALITLRASPAEARFSVDDGPALDNPHTLEVVADAREHRIRIEAPGYTTRTKSIAFVDNIIVEVALERTPADPEADRDRVARSAKIRRPAPAARAKRQLDTDNPWE